MAEEGEKFYYVIEQPLYNEIKEYINNRPYNETNELYTKFFDHDMENPIYLESAMHLLINYLRICPRKEVGEIMKKLEIHVKRYKMDDKKKVEVK